MTVWPHHKGGHGGCGACRHLMGSSESSLLFSAPDIVDDSEAPLYESPPLTAPRAPLRIGRRAVIHVFRPEFPKDEIVAQCKLLEFSICNSHDAESLPTERDSFVASQSPASTVFACVRRSDTLRRSVRE
jgi:hypothetical protein